MFKIHLSLTWFASSLFCNLTAFHIPLPPPDSLAAMSIGAAICKPTCQELMAEAMPKCLDLAETLKKQRDSAISQGEFVSHSQKAEALADKAFWVSRGTPTVYI